MPQRDEMKPDLVLRVKTHGRLFHLFHQCSPSRDHTSTHSGYTVHWNTWTADLSMSFPLQETGTQSISLFHQYRFFYAEKYFPSSSFLTTPSFSQIVAEDFLLLYLCVLREIKEHLTSTRQVTQLYEVCFSTLKALTSTWKINSL